MGYMCTPKYYSGLQDAIASLCKSILPSFRGGRRLTAGQAAARHHAEQLKWQQESLHRILHLTGLHREGIVPASDVAAFRASMLAALVAPPPEHADPPAVLRDKLLFLQELLYAKCISAVEYNASKAPLMQRLAAFGVVVDCPDAEVSAECSEIDMQQDPTPSAATVSDKPKHKAFISPWKSRCKKEQQNTSSASRAPLAPVDQNHPKNVSALMAAGSLPPETASSGKIEKGKRRRLAATFQSRNIGSENKDPAVGEGADDDKETAKCKKKSSWGFDGFKKWKKASGSAGNEEAAEHTPAAPPRSSHRLEASPTAASCPNAKRAKTKLHSTTGDASSSELLHDKVLAENTKKELSRIQDELSSADRCHLNKVSDGKSDLKPFFPKAWCDPYGEGVITAAKKEFEDHVDEMEKQRDLAGGEGWVTFEDIDLDENFNPRALSQHQSGSAVNGKKVDDSITSRFTNPFFDEKNPFLNANLN